jgi:3-phenylpropionate/trans-cinnamate dioxygenase ferredoxin subunit
VRRADGSVDLGPVDDLALGELRGIELDHQSYVLCRLTDGDVVLVDGTCTHQQVRLCEGALVAGAIECPKHNGRFDARSGQAVRRPAIVALRTHPVEIADGRVVAHPDQQ